LAATFRDFGLPGDFSVCIRASTVEWEEGWPEPKKIEKEMTENVLIARTVEYAMVFDIKNKLDAASMLDVIENLFTDKGNGLCRPDSWVIPDVRIVGVENLEGTSKVFSNHFLGDNILTLAKKPLNGVEYKREILVNDSLNEVIK